MMTYMCYWSWNSITWQG